MDFHYKKLYYAATKISIDRWTEDKDTGGQKIKKQVDGG